MSVHPTTETNPNGNVPNRHYRRHPDAPTELEPGTAKRVAYLNEKLVLSVPELAEMGGVSKSTVRRALDAGDLPATKIGRRVLIPATAARMWLGVDVAPGGDAA